MLELFMSEWRGYRGSHDDVLQLKISEARRIQTQIVRLAGN